MKPFHTYRDGNPPTPGIFATAESVDQKKNPIRIGDIISNRGDHDPPHGVVVGVYGELLLFLVDDPAADTYAVGEIGLCRCEHALIIGHAYNALAEVARIEAAAAGAKGGA